VEYARLPAPREGRRHEKLIAVLIASAFAAGVVAAARAYRRPTSPEHDRPNHGQHSR